MIAKNLKIRIFKYIITFLLFTVGISITSELKIIEFQNELGFFPHICFEDVTDIECLSKDLKKLSERNNIIIFTVEYDYSNLNSSETILSVIGNNTEQLKMELGTQENEFKSIFYNNVSIKFTEFKKESVIGQTTHFNISGADDDIRNFVDEINNTYSLSDIKINRIKSNDTKSLCAILWLVIGTFIILVTIYEVTFLKKEIFLRRIFGESLFRIHLVFNLSDFVVIYSIFAFTALLLKNYTYIYFSLKYLICISVIICLMNSVVYVFWNFFNVDIIVKDWFSEKSLIFAYTFSFITSILSILSIVIAFNVSNTVNEYTKMDKFVRTYSDYSICDFQRYIRTELNSTNIFETKKNNEILNEEIYRNYFEKCQPIILAGININDVEKCVYANIYSYNYLCENIKEFASSKIETDIVIVLPCKLNNKEKYIDSALEAIKNTEGESFVFDYQVIEYKDNVNIIYFSNTEDIYINIVDNPVIVYNAVKASTLTTPLSSVSRSSYNILYKIDDVVHEDIVTKYNMENDICTITNLKEYYEHWCFIVRSTANIIYFFCFSVIIAQIFVNISVVTITYKINSKELALKKILGYSIFEKNKKMLMYQLIMIFIAITVNIVISKSIAEVIICSFPIILITGIVIAYQIYKSEKMSINDVVKGFI